MRVICDRASRTAAQRSASSDPVSSASTCSSVFAVIRSASSVVSVNVVMVLASVVIVSS
jgi:hypothetical protein